MKISKITVALIISLITYSSSIKNKNHKFAPINKDNVKLRECEGFKDPKIYEFLGFEFTNGTPKAGNENRVIVKFKALENLKIEKAWAKIYYNGLFGIWIRVWTGTQNFKLEFKKSDKVINYKSYVPFKYAFGGSYKGTVKVYANGGKEIGCSEFEIDL